MALMFSKDDVNAVGSPLVRLLRLIFYRNKITMDQFSALCGEYGRRIGSSPSGINTDRGNLRKALLKDEITWRLFYFILLNILRLNIVEVRFVIRTKTGDLIEVGSKDAADGPSLTQKPKSRSDPTKLMVSTPTPGVLQVEDARVTSPILPIGTPSYNEED